MKLPIKKEYFDAIKDGSKIYEFRDAHITFICESTGRAMRKEVVDVHMVLQDSIPEKYQHNNLFDDDKIIRFQLEDTNIPNRK